MRIKQGTSRLQQTLWHRVSHTYVSRNPHFLLNEKMCERICKLSFPKAPFSMARAISQNLPVSP